MIASSARASSASAGTSTSASPPVEARVIRTSDQPSPLDSAIPNGRLSSSSLASTTPLSSSAGSSSSATNTGPVPETGVGASSGDSWRTAPAPRRPARARAVRAVPRAARSSARRARSAARACNRDGRAARPGQPAVAGAGLDDHEGIGIAHLLPTTVERAPDTRAEQRADLGARHEVAIGAAGAVTRREEADLGLVERHFDEPIERDRTLAPDEARDRVGGRTG